MTGHALSCLQDNLARLWNTEGPSAVYDKISEANPELIKHLVMANIGARAATL